MKELISLALGLDFKGLLISPSHNVAVQAFRALLVGAIAFAADAGPLWLLSLTGMYYLICAVFGFIFGVIVNYALSTKFVFKEKASVGKTGEVAVYFVVSLVGLGLTIGLMWFFTEIVGFFFMLSKVIATLIAFGWNFTSRKFILYRNVDKNEGDIK